MPVVSAQQQPPEISNGFAEIRKTNQLIRDIDVKDYWNITAEFKYYMMAGPCLNHHFVDVVFFFQVK